MVSVTSSIISPFEQHHFLRYILIRTNAVNTITFSLNGTPSEVQRNFRKSVKEVRTWYYSKGIVPKNSSSVFGKNIYTTSEKGTLYVDVIHDSGCVTFIIQARYGWLRGYMHD